MGQASSMRDLWTVVVVFLAKVKMGTLEIREPWALGTHFIEEKGSIEPKTLSAQAL